MSDKPTDREPPMVDEPHFCATCDSWEPCPCNHCAWGWCVEFEQFKREDDDCMAWEG